MPISMNERITLFGWRVDRFPIETQNRAVFAPCRNTQPQTERTLTLNRNLNLAVPRVTRVLSELNCLARGTCDQRCSLGVEMNPNILIGNSIKVSRQRGKQSCYVRRATGGRKPAGANVMAFIRQRVLIEVRL